MDNADIYLDFNATTPLANEVKDIIIEALEKAWGNPSSSYEPGMLARNYITNARHQVANMLSCNSNDIIFTSGGTESNNWVIQSTITQFFTNFDGFKKIGVPEGSETASCPHIITSNIEHDSIRLPLLHFVNVKSADVTFVDVDKSTGAINVDNILKAIKPNTCLITVMMANNETGVIQPIEELGKHITAINDKRQSLSKIYPRILFHSDAAQAVGKIDVNVQNLKVDYLTIAGHKFYGPRIGALFCKNSQANLHSFLFGGGQETGFRPGTENTPMIVGLGKACELVTKNLLQYNSHFKDIRDYFENKLQSLFGNSVVFNCKNVSSNRLPNTSSVSICLPTIKNGCELLSNLERIYASLGAACHSNEASKPSEVLLKSGVEYNVALRTIRFSFGRETSIQNIDDVISRISVAVNILNHVKL